LNQIRSLRLGRPPRRVTTHSKQGIRIQLCHSGGPRIQSGSPRMSPPSKNNKYMNTAESIRYYAEYRILHPSVASSYSILHRKWYAYGPTLALLLSQCASHELSQSTGKGVRTHRRMANVLLARKPNLSACTRKCNLNRCIQLIILCE